MNIPSEADWMDWPPDAVRPLNLDEEYARRTFAGKSLEAAVQMFAENVLMRSEDVSYMPPVPFRYYVLAFRAHVIAALQRDDVCDASAAASSFLGLVERKLHTEPDWIAPIMPELLHVVSLIETSGDRYGPDKDIYGDYGEQAQRVRTAWDAHCGRRS